MIIVKMMGGLGNQLFQYAFGTSLAQKLSQETVYDISWFVHERTRILRLNYLGLSLKYKTAGGIYAILKKSAIYCSARSKLIRSLKPLQKLENVYEFKTSFFNTIVKEKDFNIEKIKNNKNYYFDGYWQNPEYFEDVRNLILSEIRFPEFQNSQDLNLKKQICDSESVAIHIRRGDYVSDSWANQTLGTCSIEYYQKAAEHIMSKHTNAKFFLFSDDPDFVKTNFGFLPNATLVSDSIRSEIDELNLMHSCKNFIIANSSFSWWGAWLSQNPEKIVIAPRQWYKNKEANEQCKIVPDNWVRL